MVLQVVCHPPVVAIRTHHRLRYGAAHALARASACSMAAAVAEIRALADALAPILAAGGEVGFARLRMLGQDAAVAPTIEALCAAAAPASASAAFRRARQGARALRFCAVRCAGEGRCVGRFAARDPFAGPAKAPPCLAGLLAVVEHARRVAQALYAEALTQFGRTMRVELTIDDHGAPGAGRPPSVGGVTLADGAASRMVTLRLPSHPARGGLDLIYVAAHEFAVHAFQQLDILGAPVGAEDETIVAEGFVDAWLVEAVVEALGSDAERDAVEGRYAARPGQLPSHVERCEIWEVALVDGRFAYQTLRLLSVALTRPSGEGLPGADPGADPAAWRRAVMAPLNMAPLTSRERRALVERLVEEAGSLGARRTLSSDDVLMALIDHPHGFLGRFAELCEVLRRETDLARCAARCRALID